MLITLKNLQKKIPIRAAQINKTVETAVRKLKKVVTGTTFLKKKSCLSRLSIVFVGSRRMRSLNKKYLGHDYVTDVITFDLQDGLGEIVICPKVAASNAKQHQTSTDKEIILYVIHGILHLAGYDDHSPKDIAQMRKMEAKLLQ